MGAKLDADVAGTQALDAKFATEEHERLFQAKPATTCARGCNPSCLGCNRMQPPREEHARLSQPTGRPATLCLSQPATPCLQAATVRAQPATVRVAGRCQGDAQGRVPRCHHGLHASHRRVPGRDDLAQGRRVRRVARAGAARARADGRGQGAAQELREAPGRRRALRRGQRAVHLPGADTRIIRGAYLRHDAQRDVHSMLPMHLCN
eukprot:scaffold32648_cov63-Phaeocystis_antarctica.AAC.7